MTETSHRAATYGGGWGGGRRGLPRNAADLLTDTAKAKPADPATPADPLKQLRELDSDGCEMHVRHAVNHLKVNARLVDVVPNPGTITLLEEQLEKARNLQESCRASDTLATAINLGEQLLEAARTRI